MVRTLFLLAALGLAACAPSTPQPVDAASLPPLSGKEQALLTTGGVAASQGQFAQAERSYQEAVALSEGHVDAHLALADLYLRGQQPEKARAVLERAAAYQPANPLVNYKLGKIDLQADNPAGALARFERGLTAAPNNADLLTGKGIAHDMLRQHERAQEAYGRALQQNVTDPAMLRTNLAMSYLLGNQPDRAAALLKDDAAAPQASPVTRHNLALAYGMLGRHAEAKAVLGGELSEEERQASLRQLAQYIAGRDMAGMANGTAQAPVPARQAP